MSSTPNGHLVANILMLVAQAIERLPNLAYSQAVDVAMQVADVHNPMVFADALGFIGAQPDTGRRHERVLAAYRAAYAAANN